MSWDRVRHPDVDDYGDYRSKMQRYKEEAFLEATWAYCECDAIDIDDCDCGREATEG